MFIPAHQLVPGKQYRDTTGDHAVAVKYREYSTQSEADLELVVVFPRSGRAAPPHLLGTLMFVEVPEAKPAEPARALPRL